MQIFKLGARAAGLGVSLTVFMLLVGCTTLAGSFGDTKSGLSDVSNVEFYASDQALAEAKNYFRQGDYGHSGTLYKRAVELNPKDPEAWVGLAASYDRLRRFDLADRAYARLYDLTGGTVQYFNNTGYSYMLRGSLPTARQAFLKAYELDPDNVVIANNLELLGASARTVQR